jgi:hypothetical protein
MNTSYTDFTEMGKIFHQMRPTGRINPFLTCERSYVNRLPCFS